jgi:hypothetical protein
VVCNLHTWTDDILCHAEQRHEIGIWDVFSDHS